MAVTANYIVSYEVQDLTEVTIRDCSTFDQATPPSSINGVRFKFATVNSLASPATNVATTTAFKQYEVVSGTFSQYGITYTSGDTFYFPNSITIPNTAQVNETGYFIPTSTYLPSNSGGATFTPTQMGLSGSDLYFTDNVFQCIYELYSTKWQAGTVTVAVDTQFLVVGDNDGYITIGGETYYTGAVFNKSTNFTFANGNGTNFVVEYLTEKDDYFYTWYYSWGVWSNYFNKISTTYQLNQQVFSDFMNITARINTAAMYGQQQYGVSPQYVQSLLDQVQFNYIYLL